MHKKLKIIAVIITILALSCVLFACDEANATETVYVSAYDIAVKNGFVGTEEEWLASLKGRDGANGVDGVDGEDGKDLVTIEEVYAAAVDNGYTGTFLDFLEDYLHANVSADSTYAVSKAIRSAVTVISDFTRTVKQMNMFTGQITETVQSYTAGGAGVIYKLDSSGNAVIITNFHVVYDANSNQPNCISDSINVYLYGSQYADNKISATFVGGSAYYDIAVLRVSDSEFLKNSDATAVEIADGDSVVGQTAIAIGFPAGEGMSVTSGIVSVDSEKISVKVDGVNSYPLRVMRVDTAINSGNSGGGLFDSYGRLIGIVNAKYSSTTIENIGYAIPQSIAIGVAENVLKNCTDASKISVYKCLMGVTTTIDSSKAVFDEATGKTSIKEKIVVDSVTTGSKADGVFQAGDILLRASLNGKTVVVDRSYVLSDLLLWAQPGDTVTVCFERDGAEISADITFTADDVKTYFVA